ncbi:MAG: BtpA/SgcQ family protein [Candidatus Heimdallarchaeota archaeon]|nr:BtpA/SgcQ family protein [Candidatus Heimdallarchaeota archaeon]
MTSKKQPRTFHELFPEKKPIIGMLHLPALPGSPKHQLALEVIIEQAKAELDALIKGGVDAILVENYHDAPFLPTAVEEWTVVTMTIIVHEIVKSSSKPVGVNLLRNACMQSLLIAAFSGAKFIRCNFYTGAYVSDQGLIQGCAPELKRLQARLKSFSPPAIPLIFADVHCKHAKPLGSRGIVEEVRDAFERGLADAVIISGARTGVAPTMAVLEALKKHSLGPILLGSGLTAQNAEDYFTRVDGAIVGTFFKKDGKIANPIDRQRVEELVRKIKGKEKQSIS